MASGCQRRCCQRMTGCLHRTRKMTNQRGQIFLLYADRLRLARNLQYMAPDPVIFASAGRTESFFAACSQKPVSGLDRFHSDGTSSANVKTDVHSTHFGAELAETSGFCLRDGFSAFFGRRCISGMLLWCMHWLDLTFHGGVVCVRHPI